MWIWKVLGTSVGKKLLMALTGLFFCSFLIVHLIGNLMLYGGKDIFNSYAAHLHSLGPIISVAEALMLLFALLHIITGLILFIQNRFARPIRYQVDKNGGGRSLGSATMPYTGLVILIFVVAHLTKFHFIGNDTRTIYDIVKHAFSNPVIVTFYVVAMLVVAIHISHGFWSSLQTLGMNHGKYATGIKAVGFLFSLILGVGFGFIPIWISFFT